MFTYDLCACACNKKTLTKYNHKKKIKTMKRNSKIVENSVMEPYYDVLKTKRVVIVDYVTFIWRPCSYQFDNEW